MVNIALVVMKSCVFSACENYKVLTSIVRSVAVEVMNHLMSRKRPAEGFHNNGVRSTNVATAVGVRMFGEMQQHISVYVYGPSVALFQSVAALPTQLVRSLAVAAPRVAARAGMPSRAYGLQVAIVTRLRSALLRRAAHTDVFGGSSAAVASSVCDSQLLGMTPTAARARREFRAAAVRARILRVLSALSARCDRQGATRTAARIADLQFHGPIVALRTAGGTTW